MELRWRRITAHTRHPFRIARGGSSVKGDGTEIERVVVSIKHEDITGYGEAAPVPYYHQTLESVEETLAKAGPILGDDPGDIDGIVDRLLDAFDDQRATVSAIDLALHDWVGKVRGLPVWRLLGLNPVKTPPTSMTIGIDRLDLLPEKIALAEGFRILKIKVGTDTDVDTLTELRRLAPDTTLRVDANCGWPSDAIVERMQAILGFGLELIEQPTKAGLLDAVKEARPYATVPLIADEDSRQPEDVDRLVDVYDGINVKLSKCGGIREGLRMIAQARTAGMKIMLGCMIETSLGVSGAAHIASLVDYVDLDGHLLLRDDPFSGLLLRDGVVLPGDGFGLGVTWRGGHPL